MGIALIVVTAVVMVVLAFTERPSDPIPAAPNGEVPDPRGVYDPVLAGEPLPEGYRQVLGRDMIHPVYEPVFVEAHQVDWRDNTDVIGVAGVGVAKAYPVSHLSFREMVIDELEGTPILVSW